MYIVDSFKVPRKNSVKQASIMVIADKADNISFLLWYLNYSDILYWRIPVVQEMRKMYGLIII